ncbi:uncharacterized protein VICG_00866 [Vittaforma corneae ATCC 50505]|uniref:SP-RING-type domain-containing protein n=1 Tax=Vittaforma corneae (strain ATCC 50505) TaxID=993615 RepID=L2GN21_VITCO|nr:uncharacterized protein VICG_00866 [Vittaforma corneae ATCC 50505]ELA42019.1 hypothetical protein VICG_00866 [Vittaforma corneae ATCC 50505]
MENAMKERAAILEKILSDLFKTVEQPPETLLKKISIHQALAAMPQKIVAPRSIKPNIDAIIDKYASQVDVVGFKENMICPLSQGPIKNPWMGECGHVFEEAYIIDYMKKDKTQYCPIHGCDKRLIRRNFKVL